MRIILLFLLLGTVGFIPVSAQPNANQNDQFRDVTAAGPFPLFFTLHWSEIVGNQDFKDWTGIQKQLDGFGLDLGVKLVRSIFFETGYERFTKSPKGESYPRLIYNTISARIGWRRTFFYPLGSHLQLGAFVRNTEFITSGDRVQFRTLGRFDYQWGLDGRFRFVVLDPVGTGGGVGFFIEARGQYLFHDKTLNFVSPDREFETDRFYGVFSFGVIVPLALRRIP